MSNPDLKTTFNEAAEKYHRFRPHYPVELFKKLIVSTHLTPESNLLEIGPGTGQATEPIAQNGYNITAIELGDALAQKARTILQGHPNVTIITGAFETTALPEASFDMIFSATAFHWIQSEYKFRKTSALLKSGGYLAIIHSEHVSDERSDPFFLASQSIYSKYNHNGSATEKPHLPKISELAPPKIDADFFTIESFTAYPRTITYSGSEYAGLLSTYSPTLAMPEGERRMFLTELKSLIDTAFNGTTTRSFAMTLTIARKKQ